jgi:beta-lactamase class A
VLLVGALARTPAWGGEPLVRADAVAYLASIRPSKELQIFLDGTVAELTSADSRLSPSTLHIALIDMTVPDAPRIAHWRGDALVYPASVVKFVYLMAAFAWQEEGRLHIDTELDRQLRAMTYHSSNRATQRVLRRLTKTEAGPELGSAEYASFRKRRLAVKEWLQALGITDLHCVHPTYDGGGDLFGRDVQFLRDRTLQGGLGSAEGGFRNRQAMTAVDTAKLLALLATDRALSKESSKDVRERMRRDPKRQPYLVHRIAGGAARLPDLEVYSKTGTWGPIYADAGIVRHASGKEFVLTVFIKSTPRYRGDFIADLTHRSARRLLGEGTGDAGERPPPTRE